MTRIRYPPLLRWMGERFTVGLLWIVFLVYDLVKQLTLALPLHGDTCVLGIFHFVPGKWLDIYIFVEYDYSHDRRILHLSCHLDFICVFVPFCTECYTPGKLPFGSAFSFLSLRTGLVGWASCKEAGSRVSSVNTKNLDQKPSWIWETSVHTVGRMLWHEIPFLNFSNIIYK